MSRYSIDLETDVEGLLRATYTCDGTTRPGDWRTPVTSWCGDPEADEPRPAQILEAAHQGESE